MPTPNIALKFTINQSNCHFISQNTSSRLKEARPLSLMPLIGHTLHDVKGGHLLAALPYPRFSVQFTVCM